MLDNKIHLGKILINAPVGLKLYSPCYGYVRLKSVDDYNLNVKRTPMIICNSLSGNEKRFFMDGSISTNGECMLFPSKDYRSWNDWQIYLFKNGDIISKEFDDEHGIAQTVIFSDNINIDIVTCINTKGEKINITSLNEYHYASLLDKNIFNRELLLNGLKWDKTEKGIVNATEEDIENVRRTNELLLNITEKKKFDVSTLKPFDRILYVQPYTNNKYGWWRAGIVSYVDIKTKNHNVYIVGLDKPIIEVIPYEGNEDKLGEIVKEADFYIN